jgi:hypothetical protein
VAVEGVDIMDGSQRRQARPRRGVDDGKSTEVTCKPAGV